MYFLARSLSLSSLHRHLREKNCVCVYNICVIMRVCIIVCMCAREYVSMHVCISACICARTPTCVCVYIYISRYVHNVIYTDTVNIHAVAFTFGPHLSV